MLDAMETEHARIDSLLSAADASLAADRAGLARNAQALAQALAAQSPAGVCMANWCS